MPHRGSMVLIPALGPAILHQIEGGKKPEIIKKITKIPPHTDQERTKPSKQKKQLQLERDLRSETLASVKNAYLSRGIGSSSVRVPVREASSRARTGSGYTAPEIAGS